MIPRTSMEPLAQQLYRELAAHLVDRLGWCPTHLGTRRVCALCDFVWTGTTGEGLECDGLAARVVDAGGFVPLAGPCARCGAEATLCIDCFYAAEPPVDVGLTPKECERFYELAGYLKPRAARALEGPGDGAGREPHGWRRS